MGYPSLGAFLCDDGRLFTLCIELDNCCAFQCEWFIILGANDFTGLMSISFSFLLLLQRGGFGRGAPRGGGRGGFGGPPQ